MWKAQDETMSAHYNPSKVVKLESGKVLEAIDVIEAWDLNRNLAQVVAYVLRADRKGQRDRDLEKAIDYLWRERYGTWAPKVAQEKGPPPIRAIKNGGTYYNPDRKCGVVMYGVAVYCHSTCQGCGTLIGKSHTAQEPAETELCESWCGEKTPQGYRSFCTSACCSEGRPLRPRKAPAK